MLKFLLSQVIAAAYDAAFDAAVAPLVKAALASSIPGRLARLVQALALAGVSAAVAAFPLLFAALLWVGRVGIVLAALAGALLRRGWRELADADWS